MTITPYDYNNPTRMLDDMNIANMLDTAAAIVNLSKVYNINSHWNPEEQSITLDYSYETGETAIEVLHTMSAYLEKIAWLLGQYAGECFEAAQDYFDMDEVAGLVLTVSRQQERIRDLERQLDDDEEEE